MTDEWAMPGSSAPQPRAVAAAESDEVAPPRDAARPTPRPLPMRPQSVIEVLDGGFAVVRARPGPVLGIAAVFIVPLSVIAAWFRRDLLADDAVDLFEEPSLLFATAPGEDGWALLVSFLARSVAQTFVAVAIGMLVTAWYSDRDLELGAVVVRLVRRSPVILAAWLLAHLAQAVGLVGFGIGALIVAVFTTVVAPVVAIEGVGPITALRRSHSLVRGRFGAVLGFFLLSGLFAEVLAAILGLLPTLLGLLLTVDGGWVLVVVGSVVAGVVSTSFLAAATVALYLDLRVRREGIDLQLLVPERFPS